MRLIMPHPRSDRRCLSEVTPVREIDKISIGIGEPGPITRKLQAAFSAAAKDVPAAHPEWLAFL